MTGRDVGAGFEADFAGDEKEVFTACAILLATGGAGVADFADLINSMLEEEDRANSGERLRKSPVMALV